MLNEKFLMLDTETTNSLDDPFVYDLGYAVIDIEGNIYERGSFVNKDIFNDYDMMKWAYFFDKMPQYFDEIQKGERIVEPWYWIRKIVREVMRDWDVRFVVAHNARFDYRSTAYTQRYLTKSKYRYFFPFGTHIVDTLKMAREVFKDDTLYQEWCAENEYLNGGGHAQYKAEILYRYISGDNDFIEAHTALEDVMIEKDIFVECLRRDPNVNGILW